MTAEISCQVCGRTILRDYFSLAQIKFCCYCGSKLLPSKITLDDVIDKNMYNQDQVEAIRQCCGAAARWHTKFFAGYTSILEWILTDYNIKRYNDGQVILDKYIVSSHSLEQK